MKTIILISLFFVLKPVYNLNAIGCPGFMVESQEDLDDYFDERYYCKEIEGDLYFRLHGEIDLSGLKRIKKIAGTLNIEGWFTVKDLSGFSNLEEIGGDLIINGFIGLDNLKGLENLKTVGGTLVISETSFTSLGGLENIETVRKGIYIGNNDRIISINALSNRIKLTDSLSHLTIFYNPKLEICNTEFVCSVDTSKVSVSIENNGIGCNSYAEVNEACIQSSIEEKKSIDNSIEYISARQIMLNYYEADINYLLVNYLGQDVTEKTSLENGVIDLESLKQGLYFLVIDGKSIKLYIN